MTPSTFPLNILPNHYVEKSLVWPIVGQRKPLYYVLKMEQLTDKGLHLDDLQRLRVLEPDATEQVIWISHNYSTFLTGISLQGQGFER